MTSSERYDVFLSHNREDLEAVEILARRLREEAKLHPFLDRWHLIPGQPWQEAIEQALAQSDTVAVFVGPSGISPWHNEEMRAALDEAVRSRDEVRIIPVLLPGAEEASIRGFLARRTWVDFRAGLDEAEAFQRLAAGIKGEALDVGSYELPDEPAPYRGLLRFEAEHARFYFGRDEERRRLAEKLAQYPFVALVGASGSGKSSLVRAGLLPDLAADALPASSQWHVLTLTPGSDPLRSLASQLATLAPPGIDRAEVAGKRVEQMAERADGLRTALMADLADCPQPVLLFVDQFEELFTAGPEDPRRSRSQAEPFIANLADAVALGDGQIRVLITLRADFLDRCLAFPALRDLLQDRQVLLGPMEAASLREVIVRPAQEVGALFEKGLVGLILRDLQAGPGALPLLEHALYELWRARRGPWLTMEAYEASEGVQGALRRRAQATYEGLSEPQQPIARQVLLRLTALGEGVPDTRRRVDRAELYPVGVDPGQVDAVLQALSGPGARLIVAAEESVEVAHEALIQQWDTLRGWLEEDRDGLRLHRHLTESAEEWEGLGRDAGELYRGARLAQAEEWAAAHAGALNPLERAFLEASQAWRDREAADREARRQRELDAAHQLAEEADARRKAEKTARREAEQRAEEEVKNSRRLRRMVVAVALLLVAALVAGVIAWTSGQKVRREQLTTRHHLYVSDMSLIEAWQEENRDPQRIEELLARQLAERGQEDLRGFEWYHLWRQYHGCDRIMSTRSRVNSAAFAPDGNTVAADVAGTVRVWDAATGEPRFTIADNATAWYSTGDRASFMSFAPDGALITLAEDGQTLRFGDPVTGQEQRVLRHERELGNLLLSPDGMTLATSPTTYYRDYGLWDLGTGEEKILEAEYGLGPGSSWEFAPDGQTLALGYEWGGVVLWDVTTGQRQAELEGERTADLAFSPDGSTLAAATSPGTVTLWDLDTQQARLTLEGFKGSQSARAGVQFSPDGRTVVVVVGDPDVDFPVQESWVRSWDAASGKERFTLGELDSGFAVSLLFAPDGQTFATSGKDNIVRLWDAATGKLRNTLGVHGDRITDLAFSSDSQVLASSSHDGTVRLWDMAVEPDYLDLPLPLQPSEDTSLAFSSDGKMLATGSRGGTITLWTLPTFERRSTFQAHTEEVVGLVFDPAGSRLASASADQSVKVWDVAGAEPLVSLTGHPFTGYPGEVGAFFFHGENLVLALRERWPGPPPAVKSWDLTTVEETAHLEQGDPATLSALTPDGPLAATIGSCEITLWKLATGEGRTLFRHDPCSGIDIQQAAFSPDGKTLAAGVRVRNGRGDGERLTGVRLWDVGTCTERLTLPVPMIGFDEDTSLRSLAFSPNGEILATVSEPTIVRLWDLQAGKPLGILEESATVRSALFSPDGGTLATLNGVAPPAAGSSEIGLWEVETKRQKAKLQLAHRVDTIAFSPDGKMLATLPSGYGGTPVTLWDTGSGRWLATLSEPWSVIINAAPTEDGRILAATGETDPMHGTYVVKVRDMATGETVATLEEMRWLEFSPDGARGVVRGPDGALALVDLASEQVVTTLDGQGHSLSACGPRSAFSADGRLLATIAEEAVTVWDVTAAEAQEQGTFAGGGPVALAPDGRSLATWNGDDVIQLWNVRTGKKRVTLSGFESTPTCVLFSPDGKNLVTAVKGSMTAQVKARLWDAANGQQRVILQGYEGNGIVAFSPDGKTLATGAEDGSVDLWDPLTGRRLLTLHGRPGGRLAFSPDGKTLVATHPGEIRLWWAATEEDVRASGQLQGETP